MSTINYTYNVIVDRFRQFAAGHFQLRRFTHGEISQADLEKEAEWPWLHVKPRAINYAPGTRTFSFEIFISDLPRDKEDKTGYQAESINDCSLIFQDLINEIYLGNMFGSNVELTRPVNAEPFVEQYTHTLTGVTGIIELNLDYDWSACSIPASWNYNTPTDSGTDGWGALQFIESLDQNGAFVSLLNDVEAPGNSYYYGTNGAGVKGWYAIVDNVGLTCETLPDCATIISILDDIAALQTDVALKANTADLGATAFSNDYNDLDNLPTIPTATSDLTNDSGFITLGDVPAQVNSDWNATSGAAQILNKPSIPSIAGLATVTYVDAQDATKQNTLVSGTNIKTIEGQSLLGAGNIDLTKSDVGLSNVDNTSDLNKPISTATQTALNTKQDSLGFTPVPTTRSITINGTTQDLSTDRTFTIATNAGTVTSVAALTLGTTGTDLSSTVANSTSTPVITLNVPTASATNRGVLSSTDWSTFNSKQAALVSGTNIKTINSTSVLGSGDIAVQATLVSGTNIKTINSTSLLGSGNITVGTFTLPSLTSGSVLFSDGTTIAQSNAQLFWDNTNSRLGIGTATPATTLQIAGTTTTQSIIPSAHNTYDLGTLANRFKSAYFNGTLAAVSTYTNNLLFGVTDLGIFNSTGTKVLQFFGTGNLLLQNGGTFTDAGYRLDVNGTARVSGLTRSTDIFVVGGTATTNTANARFWSSGGQAPTSGLYRGFYTDISWIPSSGSAEWYGLDLRPTINQTGTATGVTRGLYIAPTLTAAADFRAIEVASGITVLGASTTAKASLRIPSGIAPTSPVNGDIWFDGTNIKMQIGGVTKTFTLI